MDTTQTNTDTKSFRFQLEKLDGGFISDLTGKRKIYKDANEIVDMLSLEDILKKVSDDVYHLNIDLVQKDRMEDYLDLAALYTEEKAKEVSLYDEAKAEGIIEGADEFNPDKPVEEEECKSIKVTASNAYSAARLKSLDWAYFEEHLPLTASEKAAICGGSASTVYQQFVKAKTGKATFNLTKTRIGFTILAKYYEANLGIRTSTKDQLDQLKENMLATLRELELIASTNKFTKSTEVNKKINEMRKHLL
jgi:hypothetical protein